jgi:hypothetical protein
MAYVGEVYIDVQGTQFGFQEQVSVIRIDKLAEPGQERGVTTTLHEVDAPIWTFPVWCVRLWCLLHGHGFVRKG